ncbi:uncharacterized protein Ecym_7133 [Eremothecium cymbalariae DBVPG|uniref:Amino acid transporter transmembrane domain-containing protein n=1 Tax=Eremothecium cymbalariae (strain CBS 270.75 / DBVPG 7215 / KCTC 17166 / NRRL Y-17582) TaxID=931890 RepID=G8JVW8_ERECY|nr:hypothetical protein Ecym_7133 [Eremothecium cymbalariae DBVPG\
MRSSVQSGVLTLLHTACGAGILAMPYAFRSFGLLPGFLIIVFCGFSALTGLVLQSYVSKYVAPRHVSFFELAQISYPELSIVFDCAIAVKCFGVGISYMVVVGDLMPQIVSTFTSNQWLLERTLQITLCMLFIVTPLCFMRKLDSLRYASMVAISSVAYLCVLVVYHFLFPSSDIRQAKGIVSIGFPENNSAASMLSSFPIFVFAYTCHHNMFSIVNELRDNSLTNCVRVVLIAMGLAVSLYTVIGGSGYLTFGDNITGNIVTIYPRSVSSTLARIAIVLLVMLAFPLQCHPARASINNIWCYFSESKIFSPLANEESGLMRHEGSPRTPPSNNEFSISPDWSPLQTSSQPIPTTTTIEGKRFFVITTSILIASYTLAVSVSSFARVLAIVGATGSTSISFILPGIFGYHFVGSEYSAKDIPRNLKILKYLAFALTIWGIIVMFTCLTAAVFFNPTH